MSRRNLEPGILLKPALGIIVMSSLDSYGQDGGDDGNIFHHSDISISFTLRAGSSTNPKSPEIQTFSTTAHAL